MSVEVLFNIVDQHRCVKREYANVIRICKRLIFFFFYFFPLRA